MRRRVARARLAVALCVAMMMNVLPVAATMAASPSASANGDGVPVPGAVTDDAIWTGAGYDHLIRFNDLEFDPAEGVLVPPHLRSVDGYRILQFDGPVDRTWKDELAGMGVEFFWYLPNYGYVVRLPDTEDGTVEAVRSAGHVRALYPYHTAFKLPKYLWEVDLDATDMDMVAVPLHDEHDLAAGIAAMGGRVYDVSGGEVPFTLRADHILEVARMPQTGWVQPFSEPEVLNDNYGRTIKVRQQSDGAFANDGVSMWSYNGGSFPGVGAGEYAIVAVYDTGMDVTHPAYQNTPGDPSKLVWFKDYTDGSENDWHDSGSHGTHTSCTVLGNGLWRASDPGTAGRYAGMAPRARLIGQMGLSVGAGSVYTHLNDVHTHGANLTSNSWGDPGSHKDYTALSRNYDLYTRDANTSRAGDQQLLSVFAAGNEGNSGPREPAVAKNVLTVGATGNDKGSSSSTVVGFSAKGPTEDGRTKPDIVTPGDGVVSCSTGSTSYRSASGTSMACPGAAGGVAVVMSYYNKTYGFTPSPALTKAIVVNGATPLPGLSYPGNSQGWGRMDIANSLLENETKKIFYIEESPSLALETGFSVRIPLDVLGTEPIRASLVWTDVAGAASNPIPALVNDLNLRLIDPNDRTYWGNNVNGGVSTTGGSPDTINNVEGFVMGSPGVGNWSIRVEGFNIADGPQDFALIISGNVDLGTPVLEAEDLIPTNLTFEPVSGVVEGGVVKITADINNEGTRKTTNVRYQWWVDNMLQDILTFEGEIDPHGKVPIEHTWPAKRGSHEFRLVLDPYNTHFEQNETNNWVMGTYWVDNHGLEFKMKDGNAKKADPGGSAAYTLQIKNTGTIEDTYTIDYDPVPEKWSASMEVDTVTVPPGETREVLFTVHAPPRALTTEYAKSQLRVDSQGNDTYHGFINTVTSINQIAALNMTIDDNTSLIAPREKVKFSFRLYNDGNGLDTVTMMVNGTPFGWFVGISEYVVVLEPYSYVDLTCEVTAPFNAPAGFVASVMIEGHSTSGMEASVGVSTTVKTIRGMTVAYEGEAVTLMAGESVDYSFRVDNIGNTPMDLGYVVEFPEGWNSTLSFEDMTLPIFGYLEKDLTITVPEDEVAGDYLVRVIIDNGTEVLELEFPVTVEQVYGLEAEMSPLYQNVTRGGEVTYVVSVLNPGNGDDRFEFWLDSTKLIDSWFTDLSVALGPGENSSVALTINTSWLNPGNYTVPIHVYSLNAMETAIDLEARLEVIAPPPPPKKPEPPEPPGPIDIGGEDGITSPWGLMIIGLLILILLVIGAVSVAAYNRYRDAKDRRAEADMEDRIVEDKAKEKGPPEPPEEVIYVEPKSTFDLDSHMSSFTTEAEVGGDVAGAEAVDAAGSTTATTDIEAEVVEEEPPAMVEAETDPGPPPAEPEEVGTTAPVEDDDWDDGLLPPTVVDDTVSSQLAAKGGEGEGAGTDGPAPAPEENVEDDKEGPDDAGKKKDDRSIDDIMKELMG